VSVIEDFFGELDREWSSTPSSPIHLRVIGCGALLLQTDYERGTKDGDVLETPELSGGIRDRLLKLAGRGSPLHRRRNIYLDVVSDGLMFRRQVPIWHPLTATNALLRSFEIHTLDVVDVVVSKLMRFDANDERDIQAMVDMDLVPPDKLVATFRAAVDFFKEDAAAWKLPACVANLNRVERDMLGADETAIDLPSWI
jgi:hypothetical protein